MLYSFWCQLEQHCASTTRPSGSSESLLVPRAHSVLRVLPSKPEAWKLFIALLRSTPAGPDIRFDLTLNLFNQIDRPQWLHFSNVISALSTPLAWKIKHQEIFLLIRVFVVALAVRGNITRPSQSKLKKLKCFEARAVARFYW